MMVKSAAQLDKLDITRNRKRVPLGCTAAFAAGWMACEAGDNRNPYTGSPSTPLTVWREWDAGYVARGKIGFDYSHRIGSGTRLGPFHFR